MDDFHQTIDRILNEISIVEVMQRYINLKKVGKRYAAFCPFHNDTKTPSLSISEEKGVYHCFGCGASGNVITFLSEIEKIPKIEAIKRLALEIGIDISNNYKSSENELYKKVMAIAENHFYKHLKNEMNNNTLLHNFIKSRHLNEQVIDKFKLGFSPYSARAFLKELDLYNVPIDYAYKLKLVYDNKKGEPIFRFFYRFIFPIKNLTGETIAFGGRIIDNNDRIAKYINSSNSPIYNKSYTLFGINYAKETIKEKNYAILVEGYFDMFSLYINGIKNVVASSGTALTEEQVKLIKRLTSNVKVFYDSDEAGQKAAFRSIELFLKFGVNGFIYKLPVKDPDEYINKYGKDSFETFLQNNGVSFENFYLSYLKNIYNFTRKKERENAYKDALNLLLEIQNTETKNNFLIQISDFFGYRITFVEEDYEQLKNNQQSDFTHSNFTSKIKQNSKQQETFERSIKQFIFEILNNIEIFEEYLNEFFNIDLIPESIYKKILVYLNDFLTIQEKYSPQKFIEYIEDIEPNTNDKNAMVQFLTEIFTQDYMPPKNEDIKKRILRLFYLTKYNGLSLRETFLLRNINKDKNASDKLNELQDILAMKKELWEKIKQMGGNNG